MTAHDQHTEARQPTEEREVLDYPDAEPNFSAAEADPVTSHRERGALETEPPPLETQATPASDRQFETGDAGSRTGIRDRGARIGQAVRHRAVRHRGNPEAHRDGGTAAGRAGRADDRRRTVRRRRTRRAARALGQRPGGLRRRSQRMRPQGRQPGLRRRRAAHRGFAQPERGSRSSGPVVKRLPPRICASR